MFIVACFTKRAQFPFISWLPAAMTAPTPVSSLVHSSTLVTAGVYVIIRFRYFFLCEIFAWVVFFIRLLTMGLGGILAVFEIDFKRVVAFSTISQLGLLVFVMVLGELHMCFFHLLSHAIFKSFLFMVCGIEMIVKFGNQDCRLMGMRFINGRVFVLFLFFSCLNLGGFPLTVGFLSKDVLLESIVLMGVNIFYLCFFILFCCLTVVYSLKLFFIVISFICAGFSLNILIEWGGEKFWLLVLFFFFSFSRHTYRGGSFI